MGLCAVPLRPLGLSRHAMVLGARTTTGAGGLCAGTRCMGWSPGAVFRFQRRRCRWSAVPARAREVFVRLSREPQLRAQREHHKHDDRKQHVHYERVREQGDQHRLREPQQAGAVVAVSQDVFTSARPISGARCAYSEQELSRFNVMAWDRNYAGARERTGPQA